MASRNSDGVALERVLGRGECGMRGGVKGSGEGEGGRPEGCPKESWFV